MGALYPRGYTGGLYSVAYIYYFYNINFLKTIFKDNLFYPRGASAHLLQINDNNSFKIL